MKYNTYNVVMLMNLHKVSCAKYHKISGPLLNSAMLRKSVENIQRVGVYLDLEKVVKCPKAETSAIYNVLKIK